MTIKERLAVLETELIGVKRILWALVCATAGNVGLTFY